MVWLPILKASLPYLTQVITAALPAFTSKPPNAKPDEVVPKQIAELQTAVTHNAESVKALATQLKETLEGIDAGAMSLRQELKFLRRFVGIAIAFAVIAIAVAVWAIFGRAVQ